jgi:hypothetical protein
MTAPHLQLAAQRFARQPMNPSRKNAGFSIGRSGDLDAASATAESAEPREYSASQAETLLADPGVAARFTNAGAHVCAPCMLF